MHQPLDDMSEEFETFVVAVAWSCCFGNIMTLGCIALALRGVPVVVAVAWSGGGAAGAATAGGAVSVDGWPWGFVLFVFFGGVGTVFGHHFARWAWKACASSGVFCSSFGTSSQCLAPAGVVARNCGLSTHQKTS